MGGKKQARSGKTQTLFDTILALDIKIFQLWNGSSLYCEEGRWEVFLVLLERRVDIVKRALELDIEMEPKLIWPLWIDKICHSSGGITLRDIKLSMHEEKECDDSSSEFISYVEKVQELR